MNKTIFFGVGLLLSLSVRAQVADLIDATPNQTQSLHATNSIQLDNGFSSASEVEVTITPLLNQTGKWAAVSNWPQFIGIHTHVLPNGNVLSWQGHNDDHNMSMYMGTDAYLWNSTKPVSTQPDFQLDWTNAFCTGHSFLADGKLLVTGGHFGNIYKSNGNLWYIQGLKDSNTYDYTVSTVATSTNPAPGWHKELDMTRNRWYPTNTTLSDGTVLTTSGETEPVPVLADIDRYPELWQNGSWKQLAGAPKILPTYPWMFQAPNGKVFYAGPSNDMSYLNPSYVDPTTRNAGTWTSVDGPARAYGYRGQGTAAMFWPGKILVAGGSNGTTVTNTAEIIDLTAGTNGSVVGVDGATYARPAIARAADMRNARHHVNSTILPDGTVLVTGGSRIPGPQDRNMGVLEAEIWTPTLGPNGPTGPGTWTTVASMAEARMYHSTAVLLPDGRVLSAGGEEVIKYDPFTPNLNNHCTAELYSPPYLFKGPRPSISGAPAHVGYGQPFTIVAAAGSGTIARVTLIRLSSVTHSFNMNQRFLQLFAGTATGSVAVTAPTSAADCPPGHYLLFVLNSNGVPSVGQVIHLNTSPCAATPAVSTLISSTGSCTASATATVAGPNLGTDYRWTINGVYDPTYDGLRSASADLDTCQPQVTFGVRVTPSCGGEPVENFASASRRFSPSNCSACGNL